MNSPIGPGARWRRLHARPAPPNRTDSLQPPNIQPIRATAALAAEHRIQHQQKGPRTMLDRSQIDATVFRVAVAAFTYYPEKPVREPGYNLDEDLDWCMRPLRHLPDAHRGEIREHVSALITDPVADRQTFIRRLQRYTQEPQ